MMKQPPSEILTPTKPAPTNRIFAMSVDVEDYLHTWAMSSVIKRESWDRWPSRVEAATMRIIDLFDRQKVRGTFFVLGWVAKRAPLLIREIVARGHELASHGYHHEKVHDLTPERFFEDVRSTRLLLEDLSGSAVKGFRAPSFSINERCWWAYDQLKDAGYQYSSSLHPISHDHYGMPDAPLVPFYPADHDLIEIPVATIELAGRRISCAGGGHFRLLPYRWSKWCLGQLATEQDRIAAFYFHPWEIDHAQPRVPGLPMKSRLRQYRGLAAMEDKLSRLLRDFRWDRLDRLFTLDQAGLARTKEAISL